MKNLLFSLMAIALFSFNANANEIKENTINVCDKIETNPDERIDVSVSIDWGRASRGCRGFGVCGFTVTIEVTFYKASATDNGRLVLTANARGLEAIRSHFGSNTINVEEDYKLSAEAAKQIGLPSGYTIRAGRYTLESDGNGNYVTTM
ncbi:hypothetical protein MH928_04940 [Flavobacterium sp. WW92]|uniref:hypothetical protein n=1 Tax=unclassified Flavobacterium TaxID=196869 RepID=UPI0022254F5B|nr:MULTISPECIES: hypothetical protein [unclassified Flavobacterium]WDO14044.1 hypothetical protein MH928_04940 [Flavobacterium sp. WW92]